MSSTASILRSPRPIFKTADWALVNLMIVELEKVEFDLHRPVQVNEEHERIGPPLGTFMV